MTICKFLWTSPHRRCGFDRRPAAKLIGTDATASLTRVGWVFTLAITAYTLVRLPKLRPLRVSVLVEEDLYRVCTRLAAGGSWIRTCMGLFLSSSCFWFVAVLCSEVCPGKASMFSRRQSCRGRSQSPVVWIAEEMETEPSKPIDKISRGEITSHRAVSKENALWPRKK